MLILGKSTFKNVDESHSYLQLLTIEVFQKKGCADKCNTTKLKIISAEAMHQPANIAELPSISVIVMAMVNTHGWLIARQHIDMMRIMKYCVENAMMRLLESMAL